MSILTEASATAGPRYAGLRLTADEYFELEDDGFRYELIGGVVVMSPSPRPKHQIVLFEILGQLSVFLKARPIGRVFPETDVRFSADLVYRPELVFYRRERLPSVPDRLALVPDLVVEIVSPSTVRADTTTKKSDYERFGVPEFWLIDPAARAETFYRLQHSVFVESRSEAGEFQSAAIPGFVLDLAALRASYDAP